ncbi:MAG: hypothetical protein JWM37_307 [Candidatus Saccharibacteria bacterium]|nr:hypothetical protein [Candidatus Saccharibacteria bacterium]
MSLTLPLLESTLDAYGIGLDTHEEVAEGISNTVLKIRDHDSSEYFLKYYKTTHERNIVLREVEFVGKLAISGLPVPDYIPSITSEPVNFIRSDHGEHATTLTRAIAGYHPENYGRGLVHDLGRTHGRIHLYSLDHEYFGGFDPLKNYNFYEPETNDVKFKTIDELSRQKLLELEDLWDQLPSGFVPMDIKRNNIIVSNGTLVGVIDFADANYAPLAFCLAGTLWDILESDEGGISDLSEYIANYEQSRKLTVLERERIYDIVAVRGWIALHGTMLTTPDSQLAITQRNSLAELLGE